MSIRYLMLLPTVLLTKALSPFLVEGHPMQDVAMSQLFRRAAPGAEYAGLALWAALVVWFWVLAAL